MFSMVTYYYGKKTAVLYVLVSSIHSYDQPLTCYFTLLAYLLVVIEIM
jgi:hypothetical protein